MGRPEKTIDRAGGPVAEFAAQLRLLRDNAGRPTYARMAERSGLAASTLSQAASGSTLPSWRVVAAYVCACNADPADWRERWRQSGPPPPRPESASLETWRQDRRRAPGVFPAPRLGSLEPPPLPIDAHTAGEFVRCMRKLKVWAGDPPLRAVERATGGILRRATLHDILHADTLPRWDLLDAFLAVCGVHDEDALREWAHAWRRIRFATQERRLSPPEPGHHRLRAVSGT
jgi:hypothetical protein